MTQGNQHGEVARSGKHASVRFERILRAPIERVWQALTAPDDLAAWLDRTDIDGRVGGAVEIAFEDSPVHGQITVWDPPHALEYTWIIEGEQPSVVHFELESTGESTMLTMHHVRLPQAMDTGYAAGWHAHLDQLEDHIDGRPVRPWDDRFGAVIDDYRAAQAG